MDVLRAWVLSMSLATGLCRNSTEIRDDLLKQEDVHVRPEKQTDVTIQLILTSLNKLDTVNQELSVTFHLYMTWADPRLSWNVTRDEPRELILYVKEIWTPPLVISNAVEDAICLLKEENVPLRVDSHGNVTWVALVSPLTTCEMDIANFPADTQVCHINITGWIHRIDEIILLLPVNETGIVQELFNDKAWTLLKADVQSNVHITKGKEYSNIDYSFYFKREAEFYNTLIIAPFYCVSFLMTMVIFMPSKHQTEKIEYSVTLLLSFQVLLNLLTTLLPPVFSKTETNVLGRYVFGVTIYGTAVIGFLILELVIRHLLEGWTNFVTGTITGSFQGVKFGYFSGTIKQKAQKIQSSATTPLQPEMNIVYLSTDTSYETISDALTCKVVRVDKDHFAVIVEKDTGESVKIYGILNSPPVTERCEFKIKGRIQKGLIKDGTISGHPIEGKCANIIHICMYIVTSDFYNVGVFLICLLIFVGFAINFREKLAV